MNVGQMYIIILIVYINNPVNGVEDKDTLVCILHVLKHKRKDVRIDGNILECSISLSDRIIDLSNLPLGEEGYECIE